MTGFSKKLVYWTWHLVLYTVRILCVGTVVGIMAFVVVGGVLSPYELEFLFAKGASVGFRYTGVWAGGLALVICFVKAHRQGFLSS